MTTSNMTAPARAEVPIVLRIRHHSRPRGSQRVSLPTIAKGWRSDHLLFLAALPLLALAITIGWRMTTSPAPIETPSAPEPVRIERLAAPAAVEALPGVEESLPREPDIAFPEKLGVPTTNASEISKTAALDVPSSRQLRTADYQDGRDQRQPEFVPACMDEQCIPRARSTGRIQSVRPMETDPFLEGR